MQQKLRLTLNLYETRLVSVRRTSPGKSTQADCHKDTPCFNPTDDTPLTGDVGVVISRSKDKIRISSPNAGGSFCRRRLENSFEKVSERGSNGRASTTAFSDNKMLDSLADLLRVK